MIVGYYGNFQVVKYFLEKGVDLFLKDKKGWNLLYYVLRGVNFDVIEFFLRCMVDDVIDFMIDQWYILLMIVVGNGRFQIVEFFV